MSEIARELNKQGIRTSRGNKFTINGLRSVLQNDSYTGIYSYSDIVIEGGMPVIISKELFNEVEKMLAKNKIKGSQRANGLDDDNSPRYWLTSKLFCGECGNSMQGVSGTSETKVKYYYYYCSKQHKKGCGKCPVRKGDIENLVVEILFDFLNDSENLASLAVDAAYYTDTKYLEALITEKKITEISIDNLIRAIEEGIFSKEYKY